MFRANVLVAALSVATLGAACSKSSSPTSPSGSSTAAPVVTTYSGIVVVNSAGNSQTGRIDLTVSVAAASMWVTSAPLSPQAATAGGTVTGALTLSGGTTPLAGTLSASGALSVQGGGISLTGTLGSDGTIAASGAGSGGTTFAVTAVTSSASAAQVCWGGRYDTTFRGKDAKGNPQTQFQNNRMFFCLSGSPYAPNRYGVTGFARDDSSDNQGPADIRFGGTATLGTGDTPTSIKVGGSVSATAGGMIIAAAYVGPGWSGTLNGSDASGGSTTGVFFLNPCGYQTCY